MEQSRPFGEGWKNHTDKGGDETSWGLWLRATSFLGNRSPAHVIRQQDEGLCSIFH